ncbi:unnamed protein product, partial [Gulo gulo]
PLPAGPHCWRCPSPPLDFQVDSGAGEMAAAFERGLSVLHTWLWKRCPSLCLGSLKDSFVPVGCLC